MRFSQERYYEEGDGCSPLLRLLLSLSSAACRSLSLLDQMSNCLPLLPSLMPPSVCPLPPPPPLLLRLSTSLPLSIPLSTSLDVYSPPPPPTHTRTYARTHTHQRTHTHRRRRWVLHILSCCVPLLDKLPGSDELCGGPAGDGSNEFRSQRTIY